MSGKNQMQLVKDPPNKKLTVTRRFDAPVELVWRAWTESELLEQWWAPNPYRIETKTMNFVVGGYWLYAMVGPDNSRVGWSKREYTAIEKLKYFETLDMFCDEHGNRSTDFPGTSIKKNKFSPVNEATEVVVEILFDNEVALTRYIEMGFESGFSAALGNLDQYLAAQFKLRNENKTGATARTSTYLNFPGNTEEAFNFYRSVFGTEFIGQGIQRFGDIPPEAGHPPVAEEVKKMVLHVELPILGGHILMATDAPKEMGFNLTMGNNMHICLEPETKQETKRLFDALSANGQVIMPLKDMFFGAYFGQCTDRFGINWMLNCMEKK